MATPPGRPLVEAPAVRAPGRRQVVASVARTCLGAGAMFGLFALAPLNFETQGTAARSLTLSVLVLATVLAFQIRAVSRSPYPGLRALETIGISFPLVIFSFASTYYGMARADPGNFNEVITRTDALYLTVTIFATVGFGDIVATSQAARVAVTVQMVVNMVLIGGIARVLFGTVQERRAALNRMPDREEGAADRVSPRDGRRPSARARATTEGD